MKSLINKESIKKNILLVSIWGTAVVTGIFALGAITSDIEELIVFSLLHNLAVRFTFMYTVVHIFRYRKEIMSLCGIKTNRACVVPIPIK